MEVKIEPEDKEAAFKSIIDSLFLAFRVKQDKEELSKMYWESLRDMYSLLTLEELYEIKKKMFLSFTWMPRINEMAVYAEKYIKNKMPANAPQKITLKPLTVNYKEMTLDETRTAFHESLACFYTDESIYKVFDILDYYFMGFTKEDYNMFTNAVITTDKELTTTLLIEFFSKMRTQLVFPRLQSIRATGNIPKEDLPVKDITKQSTAIRALLGGDIPQLIKKTGQ